MKTHIINKKYCLLCHDFQAAICSDCQSLLSQIYTHSQHICPICSHHSINNNICGTCQHKRPHFQNLWSSCLYNPPIPTLLHEYKHLGHIQYQSIFQHIMLNNPPPWINTTQIDSILAMPISKERRLYRGFNQCDDLAEHINQHYHIPLLKHHTVLRQHKPPQSTLSQSERFKNIKKSFTINPNQLSNIKNKRILIIDDIATTGASINELAYTLIQSGATEIFAWVVAGNFDKKS